MDSQALHAFTISTWPDSAYLFLGIISLTFALVASLWRSMRGFHRAMMSNAVAQDQQRRLLERAAAELNPNGGGSIRDSVDRIEAAQAEAAQRLAGLERRHGELSARFDTVVAALIQKGSERC